MRKRIVDILLVFLAGFILVLSVLLFRYFWEGRQADTDFAQLAEEFHGWADGSETGGTGGVGGDAAADAAAMEAFAQLQKSNPDLAAWLTVPGTQIDYPVMQRAGDASYYLNRNSAGELSARGTPFADERCSFSPQSDLLLVYGHHMKDGSMFADLCSYREETFLEKHPRMFLYTPEGKQEYEIMAVILTDANAGAGLYSFLNAEDQAQYDEYVRQVKEASLYETGVTALYPDKLLLLSTCEYQREEGRCLVIGRERCVPHEIFAGKNKK